MVGYAPFVEFWRAGLAAALATAEQCSLALARRHGAVEDRGLALLGIRLLQIARRHFEASTRIAELDLEPAGAVSPYLAAEEGLLRLRARLLEHGPAEDAGAAAKHVAALPILTRRQRISLGLLQAFLHHRRGDSRLSRRHLSVALRAAQASGAVGVLLEDAEILERLLPALIADRGAGEASLKEFAGRLIARLKRLPASGLRGRAAAGLSRQEHRVLAYLADGCSNKEIARALALSESAVKFHLRNLYRKLGAHRRGEALEHARERGVLA
jgi:DNA-binding CsgD family transcriptional regulator